MKKLSKIIPKKYLILFILRHAVELEIKEHNRIIEATKKDMEQIYKKMKNIEINLQQSQDALETFQVNYVNI